MSIKINGPVTTWTPGGGVSPNEFKENNKLAANTPPTTRRMKNVNRYTVKLLKYARYSRLAIVQILTIEILPKYQDINFSLILQYLLR
jgi:hypothetical protein